MSKNKDKEKLFNVRYYVGKNQVPIEGVMNLSELLNLINFGHRVVEAKPYREEEPNIILDTYYFSVGTAKGLGGNIITELMKAQEVILLLEKGVNILYIKAEGLKGFVYKGLEGTDYKAFVNGEIIEVSIADIFRLLNEGQTVNHIRLNPERDDEGGIKKTPGTYYFSVGTLEQYESDRLLQIMKAQEVIDLLQGEEDNIVTLSTAGSTIGFKYSGTAEINTVLI